MLTMFFVGVLVILATFESSISISLKGSCPTPADWVKTPIDPQKMSGTWYYIFSTQDNDGEPTMRCVMDDIAPYDGDNGFIWLESGLTNFHGYQQYTRLWPVKLTEPGTYDVYIVDDTGVSDKRHDWVLALDYDNYIMAYTCREDQSSGTYYGNLWLMARNPKVCDKDWATLLDAIGRAGIQNKLSSTVSLIDQTNCPKKDIRDALAKLDAEYSS